MRFFYSDTFDLSLPDGHRFPGRKYGMLRRKLLDERIVANDQLGRSPLVDPQVLEYAHATAYIQAFINGDLGDDAMRRIGLPWNEALVTRSLATMGGAVAAAEYALENGLSGQLAGGTHHAHRDFGAGFCVFNDFAVVALKALHEGRVGKIAIIDLDVHQGDGNAAILGDNPDVFVFSIHGDKNFPVRKFPSDLDIALPDGVGDEDYLAILADALPKVFAFGPELVLYQAGVDPLAEDRLGRLTLTHDGLMRRDEMVLKTCLAQGIPVSMAIGGGYGEPIEATVEAYANTYRVAKYLHGF